MTENLIESLFEDIIDLVMLKNQLLQLSKQNQNIPKIFDAPLQRLHNLTNKLQEEIINTRLQCISYVWKEPIELIYNSNLELLKKVNFLISTHQVKLDKHIAEIIKLPFASFITQLVNYSLKILEETPPQNKNTTFNINISSYYDNSGIIINISSNIIEDNIIPNDIIHSYNALKASIEKTMGNITFSSVANKSAQFLIQLPQTIAIMKTLLIGDKDLKFACPEIYISEILRVNKDNPKEFIESNNTLILNLRGINVPLISLAQELKLEESNLEFVNKVDFYIIVCNLWDRQYGLVVDKIHASEEIIITPLAHPLNNIKQYIGNAILQNGEIVMALNLNGFTTITENSHVFTTFAGANNNEKSFDTNISSLLLFKSNDMSNRALPLEVVEKIEKFDLSKVEFINEKPVIQYNNQPLRLIAFEDDFVIPQTGIREIIIFNDGNERIGLIINKSEKIISYKFSDSTPPLNSLKVLSTIVIEGEAIDIVNINYFFNNIYGLGNLNVSKPTKLHHILFIDDSAFFRKFIPPALASAGYEISTVDTIHKAKKLLESTHKISAIVTDINLLSQGDINFYSYIKNHSQLNSIPILALSALLANWDNSKNNIIFDAIISKTHHSRLLTKLSELVA
jgi:two-component system chemotaxis sensor kinase CheA